MAYFIVLLVTIPDIIGAEIRENQGPLDVSSDT